MFLFELWSVRNALGWLPPTVFKTPQPLMMFDKVLMISKFKGKCITELIGISSFAEPDVSVGIALVKEFLWLAGSYCS